MKKALFAIAFLFMITLPVAAQEYWNLKTAFNGTVAFPADDNGAAFGGALMITAGVPDNSYDVGFEVLKWWRNYTLPDSAVQATDTTSDGSKHDQSGLSFSVLARHRVYSLFPDNLLDIYAGTGGGFYFIQENRQEARQNPNTGFWQVEEVNNYLDTKGDAFVLLGFNAQIVAKVNIYWENRFTYIFDWNRWDNPYIITSGLGLKYNF